jgi:LuxR family maltose regulon positive regulatory protein
MSSRTTTFLGWVTGLPEQVLLTRPLLSVYQAGMLLIDGHSLREVEACLQRVVQAGSAQNLAGEVAVCRALIAVYQGDQQKSTAYGEQALQLMPAERRFLRSLLIGLLSLNYFWTGDFEAARPALEEAARISAEVGNLFNQVLAVTHLAEVYIMQARLSEALAYYNQALELAVDDQGRRQPIAGMALLSKAALLYELNELDEAERYVEEGIILTRQWGEAGMFDGYINRARIACARGDIDAAEKTLEEAKNLASRFDVMRSDDLLVDIFRVRVWIAGGKLDNAAAWAQDRGPVCIEADDIPFLTPFIRTYEAETLVRLYLARGEYECALETTDRCLALSQKSGWTALVADFQMLRSLALDGLGHSEEALDTLTQALPLAERGGFVRLFLDMGPPMARLLARLVARDPSAVYAARLLAAMPVSGEMPGVPVPEEPISEREREVLGLIAAGLSNREIADTLVLAPSTIKTHINHIYRKLDVSKRTQAVARARELGIL